MNTDNDFMELGDTGVVPLGEGWFYDKGLGEQFYYDENGNRVTRDMELLDDYDSSDEYE